MNFVVNFVVNFVMDDKPCHISDFFGDIFLSECDKSIRPSRNEGWPSHAIYLSRVKHFHVQLGREALASLHRNDELCGLTERDEPKAMEQVEPGWPFMATRW